MSPLGLLIIGNEMKIYRLSFSPFSVCINFLFWPI